MFAHSLPYEKKRELLKIVRLLQVFEAPLLWGGKTEDELTGTTNLGDIKFNISDALKPVWENAARVYGDEKDLNDADSTGIIKELLDRIRVLRIALQNDKDERLHVATSVLKTQILGSSETENDGGLGERLSRIFEEKFSQKRESETLPSEHSRKVLFEAMRLSFHGSALTDARRSLLQIVSMAYGIDGESFNELLAQAIALNKEIKRSINLVLE
jgi:hypothetical protein